MHFVSSGCPTPRLDYGPASGTKSGVEKLNLNLLPIALALYDMRSVSAAARALGMSQPAVSMALRKLREHFNDPLFIRAPRGVEPTPRAHALVKASRPLVAQLQEDLLSEQTFDAKRSGRAFAFALSDVGEMVFLPRLIERLRCAAPHCAIRSVSMPPQQIARGLEKGEIDLAVGYFPDLVQNHFFQQRLFTHRFACLMRADHPRYAKRLSLKAFLRVAHAALPQHPDHRFALRPDGDRAARARALLRAPRAAAIRRGAAAARGGGLRREAALAPQVPP
jgi:DNA-binding transcriptional LysR family regulator